jgi:hypothetical protein
VRPGSARLLVAAVSASLAVGGGAASAGGGVASGAGGEELPGGGTKIFHGRDGDPRRVVAFYGAPQSPRLGILGIGSPDKAGRRLERMARRYERRGNREVLPAMELIGVIALANPGPGGKYRGRQPARVIRRYLRAARRIDALLVLDIQPGRSSFTDEVKALEPFLRKPRVGIAIDPEWNMGPGGVPGKGIGHVGAREVNRVSLLMSQIARERDLPQMLLVIHQFTESMVRHDDRIKARDNVAVTMNADGFGTPREKERVYEELAPRGRRLHPGFKLFFEEDTNLMSPGQVLRLNPAPELVIYE